jgi:hypothetical protein
LPEKGGDMKEITISVIIIAAVFIGGYFSKEYIEKSGTKMINKITQIEEGIKVDNMNQNELVKNIIGDWKNMKDSWNILTDHKSVDEIEVELVRFEKNYENKQKEESLVSIGVLKNLFEDAPRGEELKFVNVM